MKITREEYVAQCRHRFGVGNPERMKVAAWEWMVRTRASGFDVVTEFGTDLPGKVPWTGPWWFFRRQGDTRTRLDDGRVLCLGGDYEEYDDSHWMEYNDVVVLRLANGEHDVSLTSGEVEIYGYPSDVFSPRRHHGAVSVGDWLYVIGGYDNERQSSVAGMGTDVWRVSLHDYRAERVATVGEAPGRVYGHHVTYDAKQGAILARGGRKQMYPDLQNDPFQCGVHALHLDEMRWEMVSVSDTRRWFLYVRGGEIGEGAGERTRETFLPKSVAYRELQSQEYFGMWRHDIEIDGTRVRAAPGSNGIVLAFEGELPREVVDAVVRDIDTNLFEQTRWVWWPEEVKEGWKLVSAWFV